MIETRSRTGKGADAKTTVEQKLRISLDPGDDRRPDGQVWEDGDLSLERQARDIAVPIVVKAEQQHRNNVLWSYHHRLQQKADLIERIRREREEADRKERERQAELERKRVERLLGEADALRKAREIRNYVAEVRSANAVLQTPVAEAELERWAAWALAQADRIDPVVSGAFLAGIESE